MTQGFSDFLASAKAAAADGKITPDEAGEVGAKFFEALAPAVDAVEGDEAAINALVKEATEAAHDLVDAMPDGRWGVKSTIKLGINYGMEFAIRGAAQSGGKALDWFQANVVPWFASVEKICHSAVVNLG